MGRRGRKDMEGGGDQVEKMGKEDGERGRCVCVCDCVSMQLCDNRHQVNQQSQVPQSWYVRKIY